VKPTCLTGAESKLVSSDVSLQVLQYMLICGSGLLLLEIDSVRVAVCICVIVYSSFEI
jgi:hypothetical protein